MLTLLSHADRLCWPEKKKKKTYVGFKFQFLSDSFSVMLHIKIFYVDKMLILGVLVEYYEVKGSG